MQITAPQSQVVNKYQVVPTSLQESGTTFSSTHQASIDNSPESISQQKVPSDTSLEELNTLFPSTDHALISNTSLPSQEVIAIAETSTNNTNHSLRQQQ